MDKNYQNQLLEFWKLTKNLQQPEQYLIKKTADFQYIKIPWPYPLLPSSMAIYEWKETVPIKEKLNLDSERLIMSQSKFTQKNKVNIYSNKDSRSLDKEIILWVTG